MPRVRTCGAYRRSTCETRWWLTPAASASSRSVRGGPSVASWRIRRVRRERGSSRVLTRMSRLSWQLARGGPPLRSSVVGSLTRLDPRRNRRPLRARSERRIGFGNVHSATRRLTSAGERPTSRATSGEAENGRRVRARVCAHDASIAVGGRHSIGRPPAIQIARMLRLLPFRPGVRTGGPVKGSPRNSFLQQWVTRE